MLEEIREIEEEAAFLAVHLLPFTLVGILLGFGYCYFSPSRTCYSTRPFFYGFVALFLVSAAFKLGPYIEGFLISVRSSGLSSAPRALRETVSRIKFDLRQKLSREKSEEDSVEEEGFEGFA